MYVNKRRIAEEIRLKGKRYVERDEETTGRAIEMTETKWSVEIRKDWTEMGIKVEGKENCGNKCTPPICIKKNR